MKNILTVLLICFIQFCIAQEKTPYHDYWRLGLTSSYQTHKASNAPNSLDFKVDDIKVASYGLSYKFYQFDQYVLEASLKYYSFEENYKYHLKGEDFNENYDLYFHDTHQGTDIEHLTLNIMVDRYFPIQSNYIIVGVGPEIRLLQSFRSRSTTAWQEGDADEVIFLKSFSDSESDLNFGLRGDVGFGLTSIIGLFELKLHGHLGFSNFIKGNAEVDNLVVSPSSKTDFKISGNYVGVGLSYFPKRRAKNK